MPSQTRRPRPTLTQNLDREVLADVIAHKVQMIKVFFAGLSGCAKTC